MQFTKLSQDKNAFGDKNSTIYNLHLKAQKNLIDDIQNIELSINNTINKKRETEVSQRSINFVSAPQYFYRFFSVEIHGS